MGAYEPHLLYYMSLIRFRGTAASMHFQRAHLQTPSSARLADPSQREPTYPARSALRVPPPADPYQRERRLVQQHPSSASPADPSKRERRSFHEERPIERLYLPTPIRGRAGPFSSTLRAPHQPTPPRGSAGPFIEQHHSCASFIISTCTVQSTLRVHTILQAISPLRAATTEHSTLG